MKIKKNSKKNVLRLVIFTTITIFSWIVFDIYRNISESSISQVLKEQLEPLNPNFNKEVLESLKKRKHITSKELDSIPEITQFEIVEETASPEANPEEI